MEYWEVTKARAQQTLPVWNLHFSALTIGTTTSGDLEARIEEFEPLAQARVEAQDTADASYREVQSSLALMKLLSTKVAAIIEGQLSENTGLMKDLGDVFKIQMRSESTILQRSRLLYPVWLRANALLAAMTPSVPPITRAVAGVSQTVVMFKALLDGYTDLVKAMRDDELALEAAKAELKTLDKSVDQLNKRWYQVAKAQVDPGSDAYEALSTITTEPSTPVPEVIEIDTVLQGGEEGLQVEVTYVPGGGDHATTKLLRWQVVGVDDGFTNSEPLNNAGNAIGPFTVGQVIKVMTEVSNSAGTRTSAVRTITVEEPID